MRQALAIENVDLVLDNHKYVMSITGDDEIGKREVDNFTNPEERYPVIATTSKLLTTGIDAQTCKLIVLDSNIQSMTEFKQIIGRGTRVQEDYGKMYFTIMDFRNVTDLFADPAFDGPPIMVKELSSGESITQETIEPPDKETLFDQLAGITVDDENKENRADYSQPTIIDAGEILSKPQSKVYVSGVEVSVLNERIQYLDQNGRLITEGLKDYTKKGLLKEFRSLDDFLSLWNSTSKKQAIIDELESRGILLENILLEIKKDLDPFDLICHIAWDTPALTRKERAERVKKRDYFSKYGPQAGNHRGPLDKYAEV